jgi:hypothetical protein
MQNRADGPQIRSNFRDCRFNCRYIGKIRRDNTFGRDCQVRAVAQQNRTFAVRL